MSSNVGPVNSGGIMLLMLENQQIAEHEAQESRDAAHELGVAFLKIGNVYRGLQQSQEEFEDTVQWINAGLSVVSVASSAAAVGTAASANANANANASSTSSTSSTGTTPTSATPDPSSPAASAQASQVQADQ